MAIDEARLTEFLDRFVGDLGATMAAGNVVIGDRLGLYSALTCGPLRPHQLAERTGTAPRYIDEWLRGQAAGGYVEYDPKTGTYWLTDVQAFALANPNGPVFLPGAFQLAVAALRAEPEITEAFRSGAGLGWHAHDAGVFAGCEQFFRPGYSANLIGSWLPALDGVEAKLCDGALVADVGCGHGASTVMLATEFPRAAVFGCDPHAASIATACERAAEEGLDGRMRFEVASAQTFTGGPFDLITTFDALHDMGDPLGAARNILDRLADDGTWMIVEPFAGTTVSDNLNPVGRVYYSFSTFLCVPNALSQEGGHSLGAQAGEQPIRELVRDAGFGTFRRVAETPFNIVYEARR